MTIRRRLVLLSALIAIPLFPTAATAQTDDSGSPPAVDPVEPETEDGNEMVHSWALAPAGTDENGGVGNRPNMTYVADPGDVIEDAVTLYNLSNVPLVFSIYATDAVNNADGEFDLLDAAEDPVDVGTWVDMGAEQITLDARTQATFPITITIPEDAAPGDHAGAILAANAATSTGADGQQLTLDRRTGTQLFVRVNGPLTAELSIADVSIDYSPSVNPLSGSATVSYTVENRGNVNLSGVVQVSVGSPFGLWEQDGAEVDLPLLLPGEDVTFTEEFADVAAAGAAIAKVRLVPESDGDTAVAESSAQSMTFAPPIGLLLLALLTLMGALAIRAYRRHQRRAQDDGEFGGTSTPADELAEKEHVPT